MLPSGRVATGTFGLRTLEQPAFRRILIVALLAIFGTFRAVQLWMLSCDRLWAFDFSYYWTAAGNLLHGEPLYSAAQVAGTYTPEDQVGFLYPPPLAVAVTPFAALFPTDYHAAGWAWAAIGAVILVVSVLAIVRSERLVERFEPALGWGPNLGRAAFVVAAFVLTPVVAELSVGNVHLELLGLFTLAWLGIRRGDTRGERIAGGAIAVAALIKVFPALLVLWFVATGRRTAALWSVLVAAAIAVVALPITGLQSWLDYPRVLLNMGPILDIHDSVSPTLWLEPVVGFQLARAAVIAASVAGVLYVARSRPDVVSYPIAVTASILIAPAVFHHYLSILVLPLLLALAAGRALVAGRADLRPPVGRPAARPRRLGLGPLARAADDRVPAAHRRPRRHSAGSARGHDAGAAVVRSHDLTEAAFSARARATVRPDVQPDRPR